MLCQESTFTGFPRIITAVTNLNRTNRKRLLFEGGYYSMAGTSKNSMWLIHVRKNHPESERIVLTKSCYFPEVYKWTKLLEDQSQRKSFLIYQKIVSHFSESGGDVQAANKRSGIHSYELKLQKWIKKQFSIVIFACKFYNFVNNFQILICFQPIQAKSCSRFFISFRIIKDFQKTINIISIIINKISF